MEVRVRLVLYSNRLTLFQFPPFGVFDSPDKPSTISLLQDLLGREPSTPASLTPRTFYINILILLSVRPNTVVVLEII